MNKKRNEEQILKYIFYQSFAHTFKILPYSSNGHTLIYTLVFTMHSPNSQYLAKTHNTSIIILIIKSGSAIQNF